MGTCIEITSRSIRLASVEDGRLTRLAEWERPDQPDPAQALAACALPPLLGPVTLILDHPDLLLKTLILAPAPPERMAMLIRFELQTQLGDQLEDYHISWHISKPGGLDERRILVLIARRGFVTALRQALAKHGASLFALSLPGVAAYQAYTQIPGGGAGRAAVMDAGGKSVHITLIDDGHLLFFRSNSPGFDGLVDDIAELRHLDQAQARQLVTSLTPQAPEDLRDRMQRTALTAATLVTNACRFAQAQMRHPSFACEAVYLCGAGTRAPLIREHMAKRLSLPLRVLNPFAGLASTLDQGLLDRHAQLPSPFTLALAVARAAELPLDLLAQERAQRAAWARGPGRMRVVAAVAVSLCLLAFLNTLRLGSNQSQSLAALGGPQGSVAQGEALLTEIQVLQREQQSSARRLAFIAGERRPDRIARECLSAIADIQDPQRCPITLSGYQVTRPAMGQTVVDIAGTATANGSRSVADVLNTLESELPKRYPVIASMANLGIMQSGGQTAFAYRLTIPDDRP